MKYEAETQLMGALRGGIYDAETEMFSCHCPKPVTVKIPAKFVKILEPAKDCNDA